ncbi:MAG: hypothetical protein ACP6IY_09475 [Promethearchaeia archaeon]
MENKTMYVSVENKGDNILLIHHQYNDLELMKKEVKSFKDLTGKKLIITMEVKN